MASLLAFWTDDKLVGIVMNADNLEGNDVGIMKHVEVIADKSLPDVHMLF